MEVYDLTKLCNAAGNYDVCNGGIVAAENEARARQLMSECAWDEGKELWLDPTKSTCNIVITDTERVIITDCNPG